MSYQKQFSHSVSGIILAGGSSLRFQQENKPWQDKALMKLDEETLLERTIKVASDFCDEIFIITNNTDKIYNYQIIVSKFPSEISDKIHFEKDNLKHFCSGPSLGFLSALPLINNNIAIVLPVDMPFLSSKIFHDLLANLGEHSIILPYWASIGKIEPLVFVFNRDKIFELAKILSFIRKSRADDILRLADNIRFLAVSIEKESRVNHTFTNINQIKQFKNLKKLAVN